jgi:hypothetical protein
MTGVGNVGLFIWEKVWLENVVWCKLFVVFSAKITWEAS